MHRTIVTLTAVCLAACGGPRTAPTPSQPGSGATFEACAPIEPGATIETHRAALARLRAAPAACRSEGIRKLAAAALVDTELLTRFIAGAATLESIFAEARALQGKRDPRARGVYDSAVALARLVGVETITWIPEHPNRMPIVSPDGTRWLAVQAARVAIHDVATGLPAVTIAMHTGGVHFALLDGGRIVAADFRSVRVLDAGGKVEKKLRETTGEFVRFQHAVVAGPGGALAIVDDKSIEIVSTAPTTLGNRIAHASRKPGGRSPWLQRTEWRGKTLVVFDHHRTEIWQVDGTAMSETATLAWPLEVVATSWDGTRIATLPHLSRPLRVIDPSNSTIATAADPPFGYGFAFAGGVLCSGDRGKLVRLAGGSFVDTSTLIPRSVGWSSARDQILLSGGGTVVPDGVVTARIEPGPPIDTLAWSPRGELVVAAGGDMTILDAGGVRAIKGQGLHARPNDALGFRGASELWWLDGEKDVLRTDSDVVIWGLDPAKPPVRSGIATVVALTADGTRYLIQPGFDTELELRDAATRAVIQKVHVRDPLSIGKVMHVDRAAFVDGDRLLVLAGSGYTTMWNMTLKVSVWNQRETFMAVSRDGQSLVTTASAGIHGWDLSRNRDLGTMKLTDRTGCDDAKCEHGAAAYSPDGAVLAVGTRAGTIELIDTKAWKLIRTIAAHELEVSAVAWRPDGKLVATGSRGGAVKLWTAAGELAATIAIGTNPRDAYVPGRKEVVEPDAWLVLFPDGSARGNAAGRAHLATRAGSTPIGTGLGQPPDAKLGDWSPLFALVSP